jgi:hypothetical protein
MTIHFNYHHSSKYAETLYWKFDDKGKGIIDIIPSGNKYIVTKSISELITESRKLVSELVKL